MFFFCVSVADDFADDWPLAACDCGVTCARAPGLAATSMKSGSQTAIRFFILNPPVRVTSLQRTRLALSNSRNSLHPTWESEYGNRTGTLPLHHIHKVPRSRTIAFKNQLIVAIYLDAQSNDQTSRALRLVIVQVQLQSGQVVVSRASAVAGFRYPDRALSDQTYFSAVRGRKRPYIPNVIAQGARDRHSTLRFHFREAF